MFRRSDTKSKFWEKQFSFIQQHMLIILLIDVYKLYWAAMASLHESTEIINYSQTIHISSSNYILWYDNWKS
jgi:hypothetical protein